MSTQTAAQENNTRASRRRYFKPIGPDHMGRITTYLEQLWVKLKDPLAPKPNHWLLLGQPHGPLSSIRPGYCDGEGVFWLRFRNVKLPEIALLPEGAVMLLLLLAPGGACHMHGNGSGKRYPVLYRANDMISFARLLCDARDGEVVLRLCPPEPLWRPDTLKKVSANSVRDEGKQLRTPRNGRDKALAIGLAMLNDNCRNGELGVSAKEYRRLVKRAFKLNDEFFYQRLRVRAAIKDAAAKMMAEWEAEHLRKAA